jgi:hypothetical protein
LHTGLLPVPLKFQYLVADFADPAPFNFSLKVKHSGIGIKKKAAHKMSGFVRKS